jgi:hypothetical protein
MLHTELRLVVPLHAFGVSTSVEVVVVALWKRQRIGTPAGTEGA